MGNWMKEDEKIEREIRSLSKLPENRRCINCNNLGPQYVCTTFGTFVCTNCSGIQREFNHRVKSVSMAKFTAEEVTALKAGGNEKARQIYFKDWDPHRHSLPDINNVQRLRNFIKQVYVDRRFTGESTQNNLLRLRLDDKVESYESRKLSFSQSERNEDRNDMRSPSLRNEDRSVKYYYNERSPKYASRNGNHRRNSIAIEVVDDRFRDDEPRSRRFSSIESKETAVSSDGQKNVDIGKKVAPPSGEGSIKENPTEQKNSETQSLSAVTSQVPDAAAAPEAQSTSQSNNESDRASFEISTAEEASQTPDTNTLNPSTTETAPKPSDAIELLLSELSGPLYATASVMSEVHSADNDPSTATVEDISEEKDLPPTSAGQMTPFPNNVGASSVTSTTNSDLTQPSTARTSTQSTGSPVRAVPSLNQVKYSPTVAPNAQDLSTSFLELSLQDISKTAQDKRSDVGSQPRILQTKSIGRKELPAPTVALNEQDLSASFLELSLQDTSKPAQDKRSDVGSQPRILQTKSFRRKELPENLFTAGYLSGPSSHTSWQNFQPHNMGYDLQYYSNAAPISAFPTAAKSTNPFDIAEGSTQVHASPFPAMTHLHGAQTAMLAETGLVRASSLRALGSMVPQSPNYTSPMPPQSPFTPGFPAGAYFEQVNNNMQPPRPRRAGSFNGERTIQQSPGGYMAPGYTLNSFSKTGGNPFG